MSKLEKLDVLDLLGWLVNNNNINIKVTNFYRSIGLIYNTTRLDNKESFYDQNEMAKKHKKEEKDFVFIKVSKWNKKIIDYLENTWLWKYADKIWYGYPDARCGGAYLIIDRKILTLKSKGN